MVFVEINDKINVTVHIIVIQCVVQLTRKGFEIMKKFKKGLIAGASVLSLCFLLMPMVTLAAEADPAVPSMYATFWALVPPVVAIVLALITKEIGRAHV